MEMRGIPARMGGFAPSLRPLYLGGLFCKRMSRKRPQFAVGHTVRERFPFGDAVREKGIVINRYELGGDYRYVVKFESGREEVFFERELVADPGLPN